MSVWKDPHASKILNDFVSEHSPLIHKQINVLRSRGMIPSHVEEGDLHMAGVNGLMDAASKYDEGIASKFVKDENENPFLKYAEKRIRGKMLDHIASTDPVSRRERARRKRLDQP